MPARDHLPLLSALALGLLATPAIAQVPPSGGGGMMTPSVPGADAYSIIYYLTTEDGDRLSPMGTQHVNQYLNRARCQCGQQIQAQVRLKSTMGMTYDTTKLVQTFVGTMCGTAEMNPLGGQFRRCALMATNPVSAYVQGIVRNFHPIWLSNGIDASISEERDPDIAVAFGSCESNVAGEAGIWMCAQTNAQAGCQSDEFFITGTQNNNLAKGMTGGLKFDFYPPTQQPTAISAEPGDEAVVVTWELLAPGDINGYRVLCEEADTGLPGKTGVLSAPSPTAIPNGTVYFTEKNLCPDGPFSLYTPSPNATKGTDTGGTTDGTTTSDTLGDSTTTDAATTGTPFSPLFEASTGTTGTSTDTDGTTTGTGTDGTTTIDTDGTTTGTDGATTAASVCGNLMIEGEEECDDGPKNGNDASCLETCVLNTCGDGFQGPGEECDDGEALNADDALCGTDCTLHISKGLRDLDWSYVCTGHLPFNTHSVRIDGLDNKKRYNFLLVPYDLFGNPAPFPKLVTATPVETYDLWDQCHALDDVCGKSGFCNVAGDGDPMLGIGGLFGLGLGLVGVRRRRARQRNRA